MEIELTLILAAAAYTDCYEIARGHKDRDGFKNHGTSQMYWKGRSDAATEIRKQTPQDAKLALDKLLEQEKSEHLKQIKAHMDEYLLTSRMDCDSGCPEMNLVKQFAIQVQLLEVQRRMNHWPPFSVLVGDPDRAVAVAAYQRWIEERVEEDRNRIKELRQFGATK